MNYPMKLTKKQETELESLGYNPSVRHLYLYPTDFQSRGTWEEICQSLGISPDNCAEVTIAVSGVRKVKESK